MSRPEFKPVETPNIFPGADKQDVLAIKSLGAGVANEGQQILALKWIVEKACGLYEMSFNEDSERLTAFAEGKRFVGACIQEVLTTPTATEKSE